MVRLPLLETHWTPDPVVPAAAAVVIFRPFQCPVLRARGSLSSHRRPSLPRVGCEKGSDCSYGHPETEEAGTKPRPSRHLPLNAGLRCQPVVCDGRTGRREQAPPCSELAVPPSCRPDLYLCLWGSGCSQIPEGRMMSVWRRRLQKHGNGHISPKSN